jgi:hypothetical protein
MQITSILSAASTSQVSNPVPTDRSATISTTALPAPPTSAQASSSSGNSSHPSSESSGGGSNGESNSALSMTRLPSYSTTVAGAHYTGSIEESGGEYTVSVPSLAGVSASGSSMAAAENALNFRIDELV